MEGGKGSQRASKEYSEGQLRVRTSDKNRSNPDQPWSNGQSREYRSRGRGQYHHGSGREQEEDKRCKIVQNQK